MIRKLMAMAAAFAFAVTTFVPVDADARDRRGGYYDGGRHHGGYDRGRYRRHNDNDGDAVAAGVVGLVLGLAIGSIASQPREPRYGGCYERCGPPPPPPSRCDRGCGYNQGSYDPRYDDRGGSYYEEEYGLEGGRYEDQQCTRRERQWDRYANRYVAVDVPC